MEATTRKHFELQDIEVYLRCQEYPTNLPPSGKSNFRRACQNFSIENGEFVYKKKRLVIIEKRRQQEIIKDIHEGIGTTSHSKAMASHKGRDSTFLKISERFFWYSIFKDVEDYIKTCENCQKQGDLKLKCNEELHSIPIPSQVMKQIGIDICTLPEVDGYKHLIVCIDYFSKWSEAKPIKDKLATTTAQFLYELMCRHGCFSTQINDQGREFVNEVSSELHRLTGVEQRVTSAYHPQANGLVERQNRTIKNSLVKVLGDKPSDWPFIVEGVLFAHRVSKHSSTKYSPFKLLYNREPVLPVDIKYQLSDMDVKEPFDKNVFDSVLSSSVAIIKEVHRQAGENIKKAQKKQQKDYLKRHGNAVNDICIGVEVLLRNNKRKDRKGGKFCYKWVGPYVVSNITKKGVASLRNKNGLELKKKYNITQLKLFLENTTNTNESGNEPEDDEERTKNSDQTTEIPDEKPAERPNYWNALPDEIVEKILMESMKPLNQRCTTYNSIINTCKRFQMIKEAGKRLLPQIHINRDLKYQILPNGDLKVSVKRLIMVYGQGSGLMMRIAEIIQEKKWKSAWLVLTPQPNSMYTVRRFFWRNTASRVVQSKEKGDYWLKFEQYHLKNEDKDILLSPNAWLNDRIMDAVQILICDTLGTQEFQSVLYCQKQNGSGYQPVTGEHIQLLHNGSNHWFLSFCSSSRVQICDSMGSSLSRPSRKCIQALYKHFAENSPSRKVPVTFLPVFKQPDSFNCGPFAVAYAAEILHGKSPMEAKFDVPKMRSHLMKCLEMRALTPFPKI